MNVWLKARVKPAEGLDEPEEPEPGPGPGPGPVEPDGDVVVVVERGEVVVVERGGSVVVGGAFLPGVVAATCASAATTADVTAVVVLDVATSDVLWGLSATTREGR